jgi:hypothetical protein
LDLIGWDNSEDDDDDKGDTAAPPAAALLATVPPADTAPIAATSELVVEEGEDLEVLISEQEAPEELEIIVLDEEPEPL